ncbi:trypsin-like serine protease [candidate division WWE3 bacterium]|uniref:Trypsin-like serine protease n=1 Tax=candidate division WWE3 bacterium TaxID=2053526 RepID=A0A7X9E7H8_UNCKA|nr:trypsin-like serine protease [candidate division WWE3 bacterium]
MIKINKRKVIITGLLGLFVVVLVSGIFLSGLYIGKKGSIKFWNELKNEKSEKIINTQKSYDLSTCNESTANIAEELSDSVVTVSIKKLNIKTDLDSIFDPFNFFNFSPKRMNPNQKPEYEEIQQDIGTGFVVGDEKFVITNKHVVSDIEASYKIIDKADKEYEVSKIYRDPSNDLAILEVKGFSVDSITLGDSDKLRVGDDVVAIGTALGEFRHTVTTGVISGLGRGITAGDGFGGFVESLENIIQTDAAINPGNSGGPLINRCGEVIGVNVAVSRNAENIGFAIPINVVKNSLENFNKTGKFERAMLGVRYNMVSEQAALRNEVPVGAYVVEVVEGSSADEGGIKEGDIITSFNGEKLVNKNLADLVSKTKIGDKVKVKIYRWEEDKELELNITMKESV